MIETELVVRDHQLDCIIGVWPHERVTPQKVGLDFSLQFDATQASVTDQLNDTINYASLVDAANFILQCGKFKLLETASRVLSHYFLSPYTSGEERLSASRVELRLTKYEALPGETLASVRTNMSQDDLKFEREVPPWGLVDVIAETNTLGLYCLHIAPGKTLPLHHHERMHEAEFVFDDGLELLELDRVARTVNRGSRFVWPLHHVHGYRNRSEKWCRVLCIDSPPFIPEDEVLWSTK